MFISYDDIIAKLGEPVWWVDGYPRYCTFSPTEINPYLDIAVLLRVECQLCAKPFDVATYWGPYTGQYAKGMFYKLWNNILSFLPPVQEGKLDTGMVSVTSLREVIKWDKISPKRPILHHVQDFGIGDPPNHGCIGNTMSAWELEVLEYWEKGKDAELFYKKTPEGYKVHDFKEYKAKTGHNITDWVRYPEFELNVDIRNA